MYLLAYCSSKYETTDFSPAELYFTRDLRLPLDLLQGDPPNPREKKFNRRLRSEIKRKT